VEQRLNPLQQVTYLTLLNVLFPMQVLTGTLIWGMSRWPDLADRMGGLGVLAPLHNLGAWLFLAFIVLHVYLTTTGHTLTSNLRAMVDGYDEIVPERIARKGDAGA
jgi:thiosulfate reductase cytochrome b subunit